MAGNIEAVARRRIAQIALSIAVGYAAAHVHEEDGNNRGDQVEFFQRLLGGRPGDPWCADFVCTCLVKGYARANSLAEDRSALMGIAARVGAAMIALSGSCVGLMEGAQARGFWRSRTYHPAAGDLALFDFAAEGRPHHVGFVRSVDRGSVLTVEGNTISGDGSGQADGEGVFYRRRPRENVFGFVGW